MVRVWLLACPTAGLLVAADAPARQDEIPPEARATALMAFLGLVLLGIFLVIGVVMATRWIRRRVRDEDGASRKRT